MACQELDFASLELIIELQLNDIQSLLKGKHKEGHVADGESAMEIYKAELESLTLFESDRAMCRSFARAVEQDGDIVAEHARAEEEAAHDRQQALNADTAGFVPVGPVGEEDVLDGELLDKMKTLYMDDDDDDLYSCSEAAETSSWAAGRKKKFPARDTKRQCLACTDWVPFFDVARAPCSHEYCRDCLETLFRNATMDERDYPPRCCQQPVPIGPNQFFLPSKVVSDFRAKEVEYGTSNRTYCHRPNCSIFIPVENIEGDNATCPVCSSQTCVLCKSALHAGKICPKDAATLELLRVADERGWQQCPQCRRIIELETGCFHMTCRCGHEFCYLCAAPLTRTRKTCQCPTWDDDLLHGRAGNIVDRDMPYWGFRVNLAEREELVQREMRNQLENHECGHLRWKGRRGGHQCEECHKVMPEFIYECRQCRILACRRCRYNRL